MYTIITRHFFVFLTQNLSNSFKQVSYELCFFHEKDKKILNYCGAHSGRDVDKIAKTGLIPVETENGNIIFKQARLVLECKKIYTDQFKENNILDDQLLSSIYPDKSFHHLFIAEIINCLIDQ